MLWLCILEQEGNMGHKSWILEKTERGRELWSRRCRSAWEGRLTPLLLVLWGTSIPTGEIAGLALILCLTFWEAMGFFYEKKRIFVCLAWRRPPMDVLGTKGAGRSHWFKTSKFCVSSTWSGRWIERKKVEQITNGCSLLFWRIAVIWRHRGWRKNALERDHSGWNSFKHAGIYCIGHQGGHRSLGNQRDLEDLALESLCSSGGQESNLATGIPIKACPENKTCRLSDRPGGSSL